MNLYQERLEDTAKKYSASKNTGIDVSISEVQKSYGDQFPQAMYDVWDRIGMGVFFDGYFQLCDPRKYSSIMDIIFAGDSDFSPQETHAVGFSAFGEILAWNTTHRIVKIDLVHGAVRCRHFFKPKPNADPSISLLAGLLLADGPGYDVVDNNGAGMFKGAKSKLGQLSYGQIYGFRPILALGGNRDESALRIYDALPHMAILAQAQPLKLVDNTNFPPH